MLIMCSYNNDDPVFMVDNVSIPTGMGDKISSLCDAPDKYLHISQYEN